MATYVAYEIVPGWHRPRVTLAGRTAAASAAALWSHCERIHGASLRAIDIHGEEFGTKRPDEQHGPGCFIERCGVCAHEFKTPRVGDDICPGCELLIDEGRR